MNAVRRNDNVCFGRSAIGKAHPRHAAVLFKAGAAVARAHQAGWKRFGEQPDQIGPMHSKCCVPAGRIGYLHRRDRCSVVPEIVRARTNPRAPRLHRRLQSEPLQMAHAVRGQKHAGPDLAKRRRLLVERHRKTMSGECMCREQAANAAADDHHMKLRLRHLLALPRGPAEADRRCIFTRPEAF